MASEFIPIPIFAPGETSTAAIELFGIKIGIGISQNAEAVKLFVISNHYDEGDYRNFRQTFRIGFPKDGPECWSIELAQTTLQSFKGR